MNSRSFLALTLVIGTLFLLVISCGDDDSPVDSGGTPAASLAVAPSSLDFTAETVRMTLLVSNSGGGTLTWECDNDSNFVSFTPTSGSLTTGTDTIFVDANREGLVVGEHVDTLTFTSNGGSTSVPVVVNVGLISYTGLVGEYSGVYTYTTDYGLTGQATTEYPILWRFSNANYWMLDDSGDDPVLCEPFGLYVVTDKVELAEVADGCSEGCLGSEYNPTGSFSLRQSTDSLIMFQIDSENNIFREIRLVPATD